MKKLSASFRRCRALVLLSALAFAAPVLRAATVVENLTTPSGAEENLNATG